MAKRTDILEAADALSSALDGLASAEQANDRLSRRCRRAPSRARNLAIEEHDRHVVEPAYNAAREAQDRLDGALRSARLAGVVRGGRLYLRQAAAMDCYCDIERVYDLRAIAVELAPHEDAMEFFGDGKGSTFTTEVRPRSVSIAIALPESRSLDLDEAGAAVLEEDLREAVAVVLRQRFAIAT